MPTHPIPRYTFLAFQFNMLLDQGETLPIEEVQEKIEDGSLVGLYRTTPWATGAMTARTEAPTTAPRTGCVRPSTALSAPSSRSARCSAAGR